LTDKEKQLWNRLTEIAKAQQNGALEVSFRVQDGILISGKITRQEIYL
jgi:hypothetical protein